VYGLFWKRTSVAGVYAGIVVGLVSAFTLFSRWGQDGVPLAGTITMFLPLVVVPVVSLMSRPLPPSLIDVAFGERDAPQRPTDAVTKR
jgi:SSS family solute:Na+ symporter